MTSPPATPFLRPASRIISPGCPCWGASLWSRKTSGNCCPLYATSKRCTPTKDMVLLRLHLGAATGAIPCHARCEVTDQLLSLLDVLVDGRFVQAEYDISLRFRGSAISACWTCPAHWRLAPRYGGSTRGLFYPQHELNTPCKNKSRWVFHPFSKASGKHIGFFLFVGPKSGPAAVFLFSCGSPPHPRSSAGTPPHSGLLFSRLHR